MVHARYMEGYPAHQFDWQDRDLSGHPVAPPPEEALRAAWASEALAAQWSDGGPCGDRLALLDLCNPRALDADVLGSHRAAWQFCGIVKTFFLTLSSRFSGNLAVSSKELHLDQSVAGGLSDR